MRRFMAVLGVAVLALGGVPAAVAAEFTDAQKAAIEDIVRQLLIKKEPDIIVKAADELQKKEQAESASKAQEAIGKNRDKLYNDPDSPVLGNPKGDVTIVEFFDYRCGFCKVVNDSLTKFLEQDKKVRVVLKEYPILGSDSVRASKVALAAFKQDKDKYAKLHDALMRTKENLTEEVLFKAAKSAGLDVDKIKKEMDDPSIEKMIQANKNLGEQAGAHGTPTFIIGDQVYPGALQVEQFQQTVDAVRQKAKK